jgi:hypothetical protein
VVTGGPVFIDLVSLGTGVVDAAFTGTEFVGTEFVGCCVVFGDPDPEPAFFIVF